jgi:Subunit CCDC53 of WASH complex
LLILVWLICPISGPSEPEVKPLEQSAPPSQGSADISSATSGNGSIEEAKNSDVATTGTSTASVEDTPAAAATESGKEEAKPEPEPDEPPKPDFVALKDDPVYGKYFKMLKCGIPKEAVAHKMVSEGLNPAVLDCDPNGPLPGKFSEFTDGPPLEEDPVYSKYFKVGRLFCEAGCCCFPVTLSRNRFRC